MSETTNPATVKCGFFNSGTGLPRTYDATDFSKLFDGIINDGVFATIGDCLVVKAGTENTVTIGTGKAWFNRTWTTNDEALPIGCDDADSNYDRYDAIVLEVNTSPSVLNNTFKCIHGTPAASPSKPALTKTDFVHQYALCYIKRPKGVNDITQSNIENVVGTSATPFVTGILETVDIDELLGQWKSDLDAFIATKNQEYADALAADRKTFDQNGKDAITAFNEDGAEAVSTFETTLASELSDYETWEAQMRSDMEDIINEINTWYGNTGITIDSYLNNMKNTLVGDPATALQLQIDEDEIKNVLMNGFVDGSKTISEDGRVISSTDSMGRTLVKTFTNEFSTSTAILTDSNGTELGRLVKNISSDGLTITSEITLL